MTQDHMYYNWTPSAIECYERGCNCKGCPIKAMIETKCMMKSAVIEIVRNIGKPPVKTKDGIFKHLTPTQNKIINAIINGADTRAKIAKVINANVTSLATHLQDIFRITSLQGVAYKTKVKRLEELIEFLKDRTK